MARENFFKCPDKDTGCLYLWNTISYASACVVGSATADAMYSTGNRSFWQGVAGIAGAVCLGSLHLSYRYSNKIHLKEQSKKSQITNQTQVSNNATKNPSKLKSL